MVHILAVAGSLMLLIGSAGQARDSLRGFGAEFQRFSNELGESFIQQGGLVIQVGRRLLQVPFDEVMAGSYILASFAMLLLFAIGNSLGAVIGKQEVGIIDNASVDHEMKIASTRLRALLRTALNWVFIMVGAIAVLTGATVDMITSW